MECRLLHQLVQSHSAAPSVSIVSASKCADVLLLLIVETALFGAGRRRDQTGHGLVGGHGMARGSAGGGRRGGGQRGGRPPGEQMLLGMVVMEMQGRLEVSVVVQQHSKGRKTERTEWKTL